MNKRRILLGALLLLLLLLSLLGLTAVTRPRAWRSELYEGMFDACRDQSLIRARI